MMFNLDCPLDEAKNHLGDKSLGVWGHFLSSNFQSGRPTPRTAEPFQRLAILDWKTMSKQDRHQHWLLCCLTIDAQWLGISCFHCHTFPAMKYKQPIHTPIVRSSSPRSVNNHLIPPIPFLHCHAVWPDISYSHYKTFITIQYDLLPWQHCHGELYSQTVSQTTQLLL